MHYCNLSAQTKISQRDDRGERRTARLCSAVLVCARLSAGPLIAGYRVMMYESSERDAAASRPGFSD